MQWFTTCGTSPPSGVAIGRSETKVVASHSNQWSTLTVETLRKWWTTALPSTISKWCFPSFYQLKIKLLYLFLYLLFKILPQNHNCYILNVFFLAFLAMIMSDHRTVIERSEYSLTILSAGSARDDWNQSRELSWTKCVPIKVFVI